MKPIYLFLLLLLSSLAIADDAMIARYISTHIVLLQTQVEQLRSAITIMDNEDLSPEALYTRIGEPGFQAMDKVFETHGYSINQFYHFADQHQQAIDDWLKRDKASASRIEALTRRRDDLMQNYDTLIRKAASTHSQGH